VSESHFAAMREHGIAWVPTLSPDHADVVFEFASAMGATPQTAAWMRATVAAQPAMTARAHDAGVLVLAGTDAGQIPHGMLVEQIRYLADGGMPVTAAIGAASWTARRYLGLPGLDPGAPADLVVYDGDPRVDLEVLRRPAMIVLGGQPIRPPLASVRH
jgi:imidazolonepropionase-like amidohydrolase